MGFPLLRNRLPFSSIRVVIPVSESHSMMCIDRGALASPFKSRKMNEEAGRDCRKSRSHTFSPAITIAPTSLSFGQRSSHIHRSSSLRRHVTSKLCNRQSSLQRFFPLSSKFAVDSQNRSNRLREVVYGIRQRSQDAATELEIIEECDGIPARS